MFRDYLSLQWLRFRRMDADIGRHPILFVIAGIGLYAFVTFLLYSRYQSASWIQALIGISSLSLLSGTERNDFMRITFSMRDYRLIRLCENLLVCLPFLAGMLIHGDLLPAGALVVGGVITAFVQFRSKISLRIPTPFGRIPFELPRGFRYSYPVILAAYFLTLMAVRVGNYNLGLFAELLILAICALYNAFQEDEYFVRIHSCSAGKFIWLKLRNTVIGALTLAVPVIITLLYLDISRWEAVSGLLLFGMLWCFMVIVSKYSAFPYPLGLKKGILLGSALLIPPLLLYLLPALYLEAKDRIRMYLK